MAPPESPDLLTLRSGTVRDFLELLPKSLHAMIEGIQQCVECENALKPIQLKLELYPRPQAVLEAVRRYYGVCQNLELDQVQLKAVVGGSQNSKYPVV